MVSVVRAAPSLFCPQRQRVGTAAPSPLSCLRDSHKTRSQKGLPHTWEAQDTVLPWSLRLQEWAVQRRQVRAASLQSLWAADTGVPPAGRRPGGGSASVGSPQPCPVGYGRTGTLRATRRQVQQAWTAVTTPPGEKCIFPGPGDLENGMCTGGAP